MSFGQQLKVRRECSSGIGRPYSADNLRGYSRSTSPAIHTTNQRASSRLPVRPHSSCDVSHVKPLQIANEDLLAQLKVGCDPLPAVNSSSPSPNLESNDATAPSRNVKRRYLCNYSSVLSGSSSVNDPNSIPTMSHFDVRVQTDESKLDHLRMYYCDFLVPFSIDPIVKDNERTIEVEKMCEWLQCVAPRTRFDAYPLWILTKDMLRRFVSKDLQLFSNEAKLHAEKLQALQDIVNKCNEELSQKEKEIQTKEQQAVELSVISQELETWKAKASSLEQECHKLKSQLDDLSFELDSDRATNARKLEEKILDVKSKVEISWRNQVELMKSQADKALNEAEREKQIQKALQEQLQLCKNELISANSRLDEQAKQELRLRDMLQDSAKIDTEKVRAVIPSMNAGDLLEILMDLLTDERVASCFDDPHNLGFASPAEEEACKAEIKSTLIKLHENPSDNSFISEQLPEKFQWHLFRSAVSAYRSATSELHSEGAETMHKSSSLLPTLLQLAMTKLKNQSMLETLFQIFGDGEVLASKDVPSQPLQDLEGFETVMKQNNLLTVQYEEANSRNEQLLLDVAKLREELQEAQKRVGVTPSGPVKLESKTVEASHSSNEENIQTFSEPPPLDPIIFRPISLRAYVIDERILKGKQAKPLPVATLLSLIANAFEAKARADTIDDRKGNRRQNFPEFLRDFFLNKYGVRSLSFLNFKSFIMGIQQNLALSPERFAENLRKQSKGAPVVDPSDIQRRLRIFGVVSGIHYGQNWNESLADLVLCAVGKLFTIENIKESLEPKDQKGMLCVETLSALAAAKDAWTHSGCDLDMRDVLEAKIMESALVTSNLGLYEWLDILVHMWLEFSARVNEELLVLFRAHDADGSGTMDLGEFRNLVKDTVGCEDDKDISRLFTEAIMETAANLVSNQDPDSMRPEAFTYVARRNGVRALSKAQPMT